MLLTEIQIMLVEERKLEILSIVKISSAFFSFIFTPHMCRKMF